VSEKIQRIDHLNQHNVTHPSQSLCDGPLSEPFARESNIYISRERIHRAHSLTLERGLPRTDGRTEERRE
jgi:hypothetical protein